MWQNSLTLNFPGIVQEGLPSAFLGDLLVSILVRQSHGENGGWKV